MLVHLSPLLSSVVGLESGGVFSCVFFAMLITLTWRLMDLLWNDHLQQAWLCLTSSSSKSLSCLVEVAHECREIELSFCGLQKLAGFFKRSLVCHEFSFVFTIIRFMDISLLSMTTLYVLKVFQKSP